MRYIKTKLEFINEGKVKSAERVNIFRNEKYIVVRPLTFEASCKYGAYTNWCISAPSNEYVWDSSPDAVVVMILQKNYHKPEEDEELMLRYQDLMERKENGELEDGEEDELEKLSYECPRIFNLEKIVIAIDINNRHHDTVFDMNNMEMTDYFHSYYDLPIDQEVIDAINTYLDSL